MLICFSNSTEFPAGLQQKLEEEHQKKTGERQNTFTAKLQENQEAIVDHLNDHEAAITQTLLTQLQQFLPLQRTPQQPALTTAAETRTNVPITLGPDAGLDQNFHQEMDLQPISALTSPSFERLRSSYNEIFTSFRSLVGPSTGKNVSEEKR